jgi:hypothetical protein
MTYHHNNDLAVNQQQQQSRQEGGHTQEQSMMHHPPDAGQLHPMQLLQDIWVQQQQQQQQQYYPVNKDTAVTADTQPHQQPPPPPPLQRTATTTTTNMLTNVMDKVHATFQFTASRIQLLHLSENSNDEPASSEGTVELCRQGFQAIMQQLAQTQQSLGHVLETLQQQQQQQQPISFSLSSQARRQQHNAHPKGDTQPAEMANRCVHTKNKESLTESVDAASAGSTDEKSKGQQQPQGKSGDITVTAAKPKPRTESKQSTKSSTTASTHLNGYKRRAERPLPDVPPPDGNAKQYTKRQAMHILVTSGAGDHPKDRNRLIADWIARKLVPVTAHTTMNRYVRDFRDNNCVVEQEWERVDDDPNGISRRLNVPEPSNGVEYTRREAVQILMGISTEKGKARHRNMITTSWIAQGKIPLKSLSAVERSVQLAEKDGIDAIPEQWGRWGNVQHEKRMKRAQILAARREDKKPSFNGTANQSDNDDGNARKKKRKVSTNSVSLPPYPPPIHGKEYTKLEAIRILQKIPTTQDRNNVIWKWIHEKRIPISHPNSMTRILREAKNDTLRNLDWRDGTTVKSNLPWTPPPRNGEAYTKAEMIDILSKMNATGRNKLVRLWVHDKKIPYTSTLAANHAVIKAIQEQQETIGPLGSGEDNRMNTSAIAPTGPSRKKRKRKDDEHDGAFGKEASNHGTDATKV